MLKIELHPFDKGPGYGNLKMVGWTQGADDIEISVLRNQDERYLSAGGDWTTSQQWHAVDGLSIDEDQGLLQGAIGPWFIDPLIKNSQSMFMLEVKGSGHGDRGVVKIVGNILTSEAASIDRGEPEKVSPPTPTKEPDLLDPETEEEEITTTIDPGPEPIIPPVTPPPVTPPVQPVAEKKSKLPLILIMLFLLLLVLGAAWYFLGDKRLAMRESSGETTTVTEEEGACSLASLSELDELLFVQGCLRTSPDSEALLSVIEMAKGAEQCGVVQRLYAFKAQSGDAKVALAYGKEYDPEYHKSGSCIDAADVETAIYWYELVLENDSENQFAKDRLQALQP
ncbi:MAG: hypothetical protein MI976_02195 [Pseudomonadales bacterium]|nr:hypothetical protein [Pseudomonadales bacterium]